MSPRALTEQEKELQRQKLMDKARELATAHGIRKMSVDDVVKAAGMAKGSFYHYFTSKEDLLMQLVWDIYQGFIAQAEQIIKNSSDDTALRHNMGAFIRAIVTDKEKAFFFNNHEALETLITTLKIQELRSFNALEMQSFAGLITLAGKDVERVKPGVVHNYMHAMYFASSDDAMTPEYMEETVDAMLAGLLNYIFGEEPPHGRE